MKTIKYTYNDRTYTLGFNRDTVRQMENNGFSLDDVDKKPATLMPQLFTGAFLMNHVNERDVRKNIDDMYNAAPNKPELFKELAEMYHETVESLFDETKEDGKNATWEIG